MINPLMHDNPINGEINQNNLNTTISVAIFLVLVSIIIISLNNSTKSSIDNEAN
jgi:hypothetical protein